MDDVTNDLLDLVGQDDLDGMRAIVYLCRGEGRCLGKRVLATYKCALLPNLLHHECVKAARHGQLARLQWARANGCPWNEITCASAAKNGHLAVLQWARANGCPWDRFTCIAAAENGHLEVLQWARANFPGSRPEWPHGPL